MNTALAEVTERDVTFDMHRDDREARNSTSPVAASPSSSGRWASLNSARCWFAGPMSILPRPAAAMSASAARRHLMQGGSCCTFRYEIRAAISGY